mgnify:CR=1 FL=1
MKEKNYAIGLAKQFFRMNKKISSYKVILLPIFAFYLITNGKAIQSANPAINQYCKFQSGNFHNGSFPLNIVDF